MSRKKELRRYKKLSGKKGKMKEYNSRNRKIDFYANIDWEKAAKIFRHIPHQFSQKSKYPLVKDILHVLGVAGSLGLLFAFPGAAPALGTLLLGDKSYDRWRTKNIIGQMYKRKLVTIEESGNGRVSVKITKNGISKALTYNLNQMVMQKPKKWDGKWRVVIFDIPEKYRRVRDVFRMRLRQLGLYLLQESVFVSPYPCFDEIEFLRQLYKINVRVRYLLVEKIEDDEELKNHFSLKDKR